MTTYQGKLGGAELRVAVVVARFNELVSERLLAGALDGLRRHEVPDEAVDIVWVPGSFEVPQLRGDWPARADTTL